MKIEIEKSALLNIVSKVQNIVEKRNTMPVLVNALFEVEKDSLKIFATNLEVSLTDEIPVNVVEPGKAAVNAKSLFEIIKELPDGPITLVKQANYWLKIAQGKSVFNIVGVNPDEYPVFPTFTSKDFTTIDAEVLSDMIEKTIYSVSNDETRYHLNGVYFEKFVEKDKTLYRMVATDGHRLSVVDRKAFDPAKVNGNSQGVIIPRKGLQEIKKLLEAARGTFKMAIEGSQLVVSHESTVLMIRLIEGKYPNYRQLIPQNLNEHVHISREKLLSSLRRVSLLSNQKSKGVTFNFSNGRMEITSHNPELGDAKEEIEIDYKGKDIKIGFNAKYILDVLGSMHEDVVDIELKDQLSPGLVRPKNDDSYTCVIMPMRI